MALLKILVAPHPLLRQKAKPVSGIDKVIQKKLDDMLETMYHSDGVGLAANQVGFEERLITMDLGEETSKPYKIINPEIIYASEDKIPDTEGCLSFPDEYYEIKRSREIVVRYLNEFGKLIEEKAEGLLAVCIQHEIDHLNGILMIDHISRLKRESMLRKLRKRQEK